MNGVSFHLHHADDELSLNLGKIEKKVQKNSRKTDEHICYVLLIVVTFVVNCLNASRVCFFTNFFLERVSLSVLFCLDFYLTHNISAFLCSTTRRAVAAAALTEWQYF